MLTDLRIKNLALVNDLAIQFGPGYNSITGETGAGKSILIGALGLVLGERADRTLIRDGDDHCSVEAIIEVAALGKAFHSHLDQNGIEPCADNQLFLKRSFSASGGNRQFVNGSPTTLNVLASIGEWLVDIHGPHDHQSLLKAARQLDILDAYGGLEKQRDDFAALVDLRAGLAAQKAELIVDEDAYARELDLLRFQVSEIESAQLKPAEEPELEQAFQRATHSARLAELSAEARQLIDSGEPSVTDLSSALGRALQEMAGIDAGAESLLAEQTAISGQLADLGAAVADYAERLSLDPAQMKLVEERYNLVQTLKRKYGSTLPKVIAFGDNATKRLASLEGRDEELARLNSEAAKFDEQIQTLGQALSAARKAIAPKLVEEVERQLNDLGFLQSRFDVEIIDPSELGQAEAAVSRTVRAESRRAVQAAQGHRVVRRNGAGDVGTQDRARHAGQHSDSGVRRGGLEPRRRDRRGGRRKNETNRGQSPSALYHAFGPCGGGGAPALPRVERGRRGQNSDSCHPTRRRKSRGGIDPDARRRRRCRPPTRRGTAFLRKS
jgi:DNA repair protein RecN (Recombination protein N)